jgi:antitoxin component of RelBE/YafQ-DinJ toxin-antitoxin module
MVLRNVMSFRLDSDLTNKINNYSQKYNLERSKVVRILLENTEINDIVIERLREEQYKN